LGPVTSFYNYEICEFDHDVVESEDDGLSKDFHPVGGALGLVEGPIVDEQA